MKILAIFDDPQIGAIAALRKLQHTVELVTDVPTAIAILYDRPYDVLLCQAALGGQTQATINLLDTIRSSSHQSDLPFVCCQTSEKELTESAFAHLRMRVNALGGQGLIDHRVFHSRNLVHAISRQLSSAVGSPCLTSSWQ